MPSIMSLLWKNNITFQYCLYFLRRKECNFIARRIRDNLISIFINQHISTRHSDKYRYSDFSQSRNGPKKLNQDRRI